MEEILAVLVGRVGKSGNSQQTNCPDTASKHTTLNRNISRRKSVFTFATDFFKSNKPENVESETTEHEQQERNKGQWNPFASLRGFSDDKKRTANYFTIRGNSLSPKRNNNSCTDEFDAPKPMRRKSLQDLLGAVGNKLSNARRLVYNEDMIQRLEAPSDGPLSASLEASRDSQDISTLVPPEPALPLRGEPTALAHSLHLLSHEVYAEEMIPQKMLGSDEDLICHHQIEKPLFAHSNLDGNENLRTINDESQVPNVTPTIDSSIEVCHYEQQKHLKPITVPEELCLAAPSILSQDSDHQEPTQDSFEDECLPQSTNLDHSFPNRMPRRQARNESLWSVPQKESWDSSATDVQKNIALTTVGVSKNLHLTNIRGRWSVDSSETDTDNLSNYSWVEKEMEVQDIIDRGKEIMALRTLSPHLHSTALIQIHDFENSSDSTIHNAANLAPWKELEPESSPSETSMLQSSGNFNTPGINYRAKAWNKRVISLENGERFRPRRTNSRLASVEPVHIFYPSNESREAETKTYVSKSSAFGDLYQNHSGYSDYCLFDRSTRTYYPQAPSYIIPELSKPNDDNLEVVWLPLEMFPADILIDNTEKQDNVTLFSTESLSEFSRPASSGEFSVPNTNRNTALVPMAFRRDENAASGCCNSLGAYSNDNTGVRFTDPGSNVDMDGGDQFVCTRTVVNIREVFNPTAKSLTSEDAEVGTDDINDPHEDTVDPATARFYLGSLFSSSETLELTEADVVDPSNPARSNKKPMKEAQADNKRELKTWFDMECDFLEKFAPGNYLSQDQRGRIAVYEAFKNLNGLTSNGNDSNESIACYEDEVDTKKIEWLQSRDASVSFKFGDEREFSKYRASQEQSNAAANPSNISGARWESTCLDSRSENQTKGKGEEDDGLIRFNFMPSANINTLGDCFADLGMNLHSADSKFFEIEHTLKSHILKGVGRDICLDSNIVATNGHSRLGSEESSETDDSAITMLSGYMFTHYAEQLGQLPKGAGQEEESECEEEYDHKNIISELSEHQRDVASKLLVRKCPNLLPQSGLPQIEEAVDIDRNRPQFSLENDLVAAKTLQIVSLLSQSGPVQLISGHSASASSEASNDMSFLKQHPVIQNHVLTPIKRVATPLVELFQQRSQAVRAGSPSPSEANTEASDNFGQKLERYRRIEEEERENDLWWTDSISYG